MPARQTKLPPTRKQQAAAARAELHSRPPFERMLRLHRLLTTESYPNSRTIAEELEVSRKTVGRDLDFMRDRFALPIAYDERRFGFYYTQPVTDFPLMDVSEGEVAALFIAQKALEQHRGRAFERPLRLACRKLMENLGGRMSVQLAEVDAAISFRSAGAGEVDPAVFDAVSDATLHSVEFGFQYQKLGSSQLELRRVRPYHLGCIENQWYCFGFCLDRAQVRTFSLARMRAIRATNLRFTVPPDFSLGRYLDHSFGVFARSDGKRPIRIRLHFDAWAAQLIRERFWHESQEITPRAGGEVELSLQLGGLEEILPWTLSWGEHARVLAPKLLRDRVRAVATALLAQPA